MSDKIYEVFEYSEVMGDSRIDYRMDIHEKIGVRLYINNGLQFCERDEYRYHQMVFSLPFLLANGLSRKIKVLVLGGGDGLGVKAILELCEQVGAEVPEIDLVDISSFMLYMSTNHPEMLRVNRGALLSDAVTVHNTDGVEFVRNARQKYDLIVMDYPDPTVKHEDAVNYLFTKEHLLEVKSILNDGGVVASQSTSVLISPNAFRYLTLNYADSFQELLQLRVNILTFGDIGVLIGRDKEFKLEEKDLAGFEFLFFSHEDLCVFQRLLKDELPDFEDEAIRKADISDLLSYDLSRQVFKP